MNKIVLYCRPGFEKECAAEITEKAAEFDIYGYVRLSEQSGYIVFECYQTDEADKLARNLAVNQLIFARQLFVCSDLLQHLPVEDRISPIIAQFNGKVHLAGELRVEVPDTNEGKELAKFCRKFAVPLRQSLKHQRLLADQETLSGQVLHVFFVASGSCYVGYSYSEKNSPLYMGIWRLKFPAQAPSRSTLKLEEAFHQFIPSKQWDQRLASGMYAVDLGASPGGWTYQLVQRSMMVYAIDNGPMDVKLLETGQVKHYRQDGFKFSPKQKNITWLVCDMIEKPVKVTQLILKWFSHQWCKEAIFNLKLPMKKRYEEVKHCLSLLEFGAKEQGFVLQIQAKQLYHDREEVTVHARLVIQRSR